MTSLPISLFVTACLHGTLHGAPKDLCHEFQIRSFVDKPACVAAGAAGAEEWLRGLNLVGISAFISTENGWRCGNSRPEGWEDP